MVSGFPWQLGQTQEIGIAALTSNILCRAHNSALEGVDSAGGDAYRLLGEIVRRWREDLITATTRPPQTVEYEIDGHMLEKWFAKCALNLGRVLGGARTPPLSIIQFIFSKGDLASPLGLYGAGVLDAIHIWPIIKFAPLLSDDGVFAAALFGFRNLRFAFWLYPEPPDLALIEQAPDWRLTSLLRHPVGMEFRARGGVSRRLRFRWN